MDMTSHAVTPKEGEKRGAASVLGVKVRRKIKSSSYHTTFTVAHHIFLRMYDYFDLNLPRGESPSYLYASFLPEERSTYGRRTIACSTQS